MGVLEMEKQQINILNTEEKFTDSMQTSNAYCNYVSPALKKSFEERMQKATALIKDSGISFSKFGVFGSYARGEYTTLSDIDFCIITDEKPMRSLIGSLREELDLIKVDITLVSSAYFKDDTSPFAQQLRRDFLEVK